MDAETFSVLTEIQKVTMIVSMNVRNEMENFHSKNLSDMQMKILNRIIRQAIFNGLTLVDKVKKGKKIQGRLPSELLAWLVLMIPEYWEIPKKFTLK